MNKWAALLMIVAGPLAGALVALAQIKYGLSWPVVVIFGLALAAFITTAVSLLDKSENKQ